MYVEITNKMNWIEFKYTIHLPFWHIRVPYINDVYIVYVYDYVYVYFRQRAMTSKY